MGRPVLEVADIFRDHGPAWRKANAGHVGLGQLKVMSAIESCRTAALGGHVARCEDCAHEVIRFPADHFGLAILGHQLKPALPLMASRSLARAAHLFPMMSSSSSIVAMCLLTIGSSTSAHSVSAGCSSGV